MRPDRKQERSCIDVRRLLMLAFLSAFFLTACSKHYDKNFFYTSIQSDPGVIDPFYSTDVVSGRISAKIFNALFKIDKYGSLQPDIAEKYEFDGKILTAVLRDDVFFHDGTPVRSEDVKFSFERIGNSENPTSPRKWVFRNVKKISIPDQKTVKIELYERSSSFLQLLTMPNCYIISKEALLTENKIIGSGPFILLTWKRDDSITLVCNENYFSGHPAVKGIVFKIIPEDLTARFEFINSSLDYFEAPYLSDVKFRIEGVRYIDVPELSVHYIALNNSRPPFNERLFRRALNMAVDREMIRKSLFKDRFKTASGPVPPGAGGYEHVSEGIPYDPEKAKEIFKSLDAGAGEYVISIKSDNQVSLVSQMIQFYLMKAGLKVRLKEMEWSALKSAAMKGDFDMAYFTWHADYPEAENFLYPLFYSKNIGAGGNRSFFSDSRVDAMLARAAGTLDDKKRFEIYRSVERIIIDEAPWIFLWYGDKRIALSARVKQFTAYPLYNGMKGNEIVIGE